jgi:hypothetical protein
MMQVYDRRCDQIGAAMIEEALKIQRAFGKSAAIIFLRAQDVEVRSSLLALGSRYDRRMIIRRQRVREISATDVWKKTR